ncbi:MAG TPA: efflux RND transporter periplasmic adaptor subunit [Candidatus Acidoferrales bacterium]
MSLKTSFQAHKLPYLIVLAIILVGGGYWYYSKTNADAPKYTTSPAKKGDITSVVQATGTINPLTTTTVGSYVSATVEYIFADYNTRVKAGQVLAQLDPTVFEAQVLQARANLQNAQDNLVTLAANVQADKANMAKSQANVDYEQATAKRSQDMFAAGIVSTDANDLTQSTLGQAQAEVDASKATVSQGEAQLQQAKAQVTSAQGALDLAMTSLKYTTIVAPIDGTVVSRSIDPGQSVAAAMSAPNLFSIAQDLTRMLVYAATDESDTGSIHIGASVTFQVDAFPNDQFTGRVVSIRLNPTTVQNVVTYNTVIDFSNPDEKLLPGETAYVTIPTGHATNTLEMPNAALTFKPTLSRDQQQALFKQYNISRQASTTHLGGWQTVWKLNAADNSLIPVAVQTGITDNANTQIVQGDVKEGDEFVTAAQTSVVAAGGRGFGGRGFGGR